VLWKGYVEFAERRKYPVWAKVRVSARTTRVVAADSVRAGSVLEAASLRVEEVEDFPFGDITRRIDEVAGRLAKRPIAAGQAVLRSLLETAPDVLRGDTVRVEVLGRATRLAFDAKAQSTGRRGDRILLVNPSSGARFQARVDGRNHAVVMQ
jgi:flagella basal body P-ring formation protein FlgA